MKNIVLVFPGQGSQYIGMGKDLYDNYSFVKNMYKSANEVLGIDIEKLSFEGPEDNLKDTKNAQPAIFLHSVAMLEALRQEYNGKFNVIAMAGHSLGEYSALFSASVFKFEDGLEIVRRRGKLMSEADPESKGGMAAVIGLEPEVVKQVCKEVTEKGKYVEPVNYNSPDQVVISGLKEAIDSVSPILKEKGAKRVLPLAVSGAFHSKLMESVSLKFRDFLMNFEFRKPSVKVYSNYTAKPYPEDKDSIIELLVKQMSSPVLWIDIVKEIAALKPDLVIEVGPGQVLKGLISKISPEIPVVTTSNLEGLRKLSEVM